MFQFTDAELAAWLASVVFPFVRIAALIATAPILGDGSIPRRVRIGLAIFVTIVVAPAVGAIPHVDVVSGDGLLLIARQLLIGAAMGFAVRLAFAAIEYAGDLIMIAGVAESFQAMPLSASGAGAMEDWKMLVLSGGAIFGLALHMALPVVAALLVTNVALGVMTRAAPQLNLFSIGFPITISVGLVVLAASLPVLLGLSGQAIDATVARFLH